MRVGRRRVRIARNGGHALVLVVDGEPEFGQEIEFEQADFLDPGLRVPALRHELNGDVAQSELTDCIAGTMARAVV